MTMDKLGGKEGINFRFYCDGICGDYIDCGEDFYSAIEVLRNNHWKTIKNGKDFEHFCPACSDERK